MEEYFTNWALAYALIVLIACWVEIRSERWLKEYFKKDAIHSFNLYINNKGK